MHAKSPNIKAIHTQYNVNKNTTGWAKMDCSQKFVCDGTESVPHVTLFGSSFLQLCMYLV